MSKETPFQPLKEFLSRVPASNSSIGYGLDDDDYWWLRVSSDIDHPLAWNVVQELRHVLNYLSLNERLPTVFKPVSPPPYMNGGSRDFLSWVIECRAKDQPSDCAEWLEGRLPSPVDDLEQWKVRSRRSGVGNDAADVDAGLELQLDDVEIRREQHAV